MKTRKRLSAPFLVLALSVAVGLAGCATTPLGKAQQGGQLVVNLGEQILKVCGDSQVRAEAKAAEFLAAGQPEAAAMIKANWIPPFDYKTCKVAIASYKIAWQASKQAMDITRANPTTIVPMDLLTRISDFVLMAYDILNGAGLLTSPEATAYVIKAQDALLK